MTKTTHTGTGWETLLGEDIVIPRGSDQSITVDHGSLSSEISRIVYTAREETSGTEDGLGTVVIQVASDTQSVLLVSTTAATTPSQTTLTLTAGSTVDDFYNDQIVVVYDANDSDTPSAHKVSDYVGSTKTVTLDAATSFTMVAGDGVKIFDSQWDTLTDEEATIDFLDSDTQLLRAADDETNIIYDIEIYQNDGSYYMVQRGTTKVEYDVSHDDDSTPYPSWDTLSDLETEIDGYATGYDRTFLTAAGVASDTDIDVVNGAAVTVGVDIRVILDDGTYDQVTPDTITLNNVDFSTSDPGGLTSGAAIGNVVIKAP